MSRELSASQVEILRKHLERFPRSAVCPICEGGKWSVTGLEATYSVEIGPSRCVLLPLEPITPVLLVVCDGCGFLRHFAWAKIQDLSALQPPATKPASFP
jgi:hypothetical protein